MPRAGKSNTSSTLASLNERDNAVVVGQWRSQLPRAVLQLAAAFLLYWVSYGTDLSDGIIYARLILPPCSAPMSNGTIEDKRAGTAALQQRNSSQSGRHLAELNMTSFIDNRSSSDVTGSADGCGGFGAGASQTAWVTSIAAACRVGSAFSGGVFIDAFGVRVTIIAASILYSLGLVLSSFSVHLYQIYLARGVLSGLAAGVIFSVPIHFLSITFDLKIAMATGIAYLGSGVCAVVYGYGGKEVVAMGDWQWYYRMVAMVGLLCIPASFLIHVETPNSELQVASDGKQDSGLTKCSVALSKIRTGFRDLWTSVKKGRVLYYDANFLLIAGCYFLYAVGYFFPLIASSHRSKALGISSTNAYVQVAYVGYGTVAGCMMFAASGFLCNIRGTLYQGLALFTMGASTLLSILVTTEGGLIAFNVFYAAISGLTVAACGPAAREVVTTEMTVHAFGHLYLLSSPAMAIGPPISGWLYDATQSYTLPLLFGGLVLIAAALLILIVDFRIWLQRRRSRHHQRVVSTSSSTQMMDVVRMETSL